MEEYKLSDDLIKFIDASPVSYYAIENIKDRLEDKGYKELSEGDSWNLVKDGRYYITRNDSSLIAFRIGKSNPWDSGFKIVGAHTDSPSLKVKNESIKRSAGVISVTTESYGGSINSTWLDRDLSLAGRVTIKGKSGIESRLVNFKDPIGIIPNLAIHLNREANKGFEYNRQNHLRVILGEDREEEGDFLKKLISEKLGIKEKDILEMDLFFYDNQKGSYIGIDRDILSIGRLDNLAMCHLIFKGLEDLEESDSTAIGVFFDNEEIGSNTYQGADSNFLSSILDRIILNLGGSLEDGFRARYNSFLLSTDGAHAHHPNFSDKHDPDYAPLLNKGPVLKLSANFRYATTSESGAYFIDLCNRAGVPYQKIVNRSDVPSGSTIGPMSSASLGIKTADVGNPMFAMHSARESQGVKDHYYMFKIISEFFK